MPAFILEGLIDLDACVNRESTTMPFLISGLFTKPVSFALFLCWIQVDFIQESPVANRTVIPTLWMIPFCLFRYFSTFFEDFFSFTIPALCRRQILYSTVSMIPCPCNKLMCSFTSSFKGTEMIWEFRS